MITSTARIATWNTQWATTRQARAGAVTARLRAFCADVAVLTETSLHLVSDLWPGIVHARTNVYPGSPADGAKVLIATSWPVQPVVVREPDGLPPGNVVAADVELPGGAIRVIGVVIRYNAKTEFVARMPELLAPLVTERTVIAGDFNLPIPGGPLARSLVQVLADVGLDVLTSGPHESLRGERALIDHIAASSSFACTSRSLWTRFDQNHRGGLAELTDHAGVAVDLAMVARPGR